MKLEFSGKILEKYSNVKFHENPFSGSLLAGGWVGWRVGGRVGWDGGRVGGRAAWRTDGRKKRGKDRQT